MAKKGKKQLRNDTGKDSSSNNKEMFNFLHGLLQAIKWEVYSPQGQTNVVVTFIMALIICLYLLSSGVATVVRIFVSIFNRELTSQTGDNVVTLLIVLFVASMLCLVFVYITSNEYERFRMHKRMAEATEETEEEV